MATSKKFVPPVAFHPGKTLSAKLEEMGMGVKEFAVRTSKPEKTIFAVISGKSSVTSDMAVAFESVTKIPAHFWLNKQRAFDEYVARQKREEQLVLAYEWVRMFPLKSMSQMGWIENMKSMEDKVKSLFSYFQVSTVKAWQDYYMNQQLKVAFRISLTNTKEPYAISAWLRRGEIQASEMQVKEYSEKRLRELIPIMKGLCSEHPEDFSTKLQEICAEAGVKLIYTPCLPKAPINGSTRWINDTPCIQVTGRHKRNDIFWFSFFHELGHILLHGKKDIFLEDIEYSDKQLEKEAEADLFASKILLSQAEENEIPFIHRCSIEENEIIESNDFSIKSICSFAKKFNVHPAIIVGRLQHKKIIPFTKDTNLFEKIDLFN